MTSARKKPGVAFWATVVLSLPIVYVASFGPACRLRQHDVIPRGSLRRFYAPVIDVMRDHDAPAWARRPLLWYWGLWLDDAGTPLMDR